MIGPVQEKDTNTKVNAMKKMESRPVVLSALESILLVHLAGRTSSKAPKKETAKRTSMRKKMMLKTALVARLFKALAPKMLSLIHI